MRGSRLLLWGVITGLLSLLLAAPVHDAAAAPSGAVAATGAVQPAGAGLELIRPLYGDVVLAFNAGYQTGAGQTRYHTGVDIGGASGAKVGAAGAGRVTFCGRVPRPSGSGAAVLALTVVLSDGRLTTYMPLQQALVTRGQDVARGQTLGILAGEGDASSPSAHLHLSIRENGNYVDPGPLPIPVPPRQPAPRTAPRTSPAPERRTAPFPSARPAATSARPRPIQSPALVNPDVQISPVVPLPSTGEARAPETPRIGPAPRQTTDQAQHRARLSHANRSRTWVDPRLLDAAARTDDVARDGLRDKLPELPPGRVHPLALMLISGSLFASASVLGRMSRGRIGQVQVTGRALEAQRHA